MKVWKHVAAMWMIDRNLEFGRLILERFGLKIILVTINHACLYGITGV